MHRAAILIACAALAACSNEPAVEARNASVEEVARQVGEARGSDQFIKPGKWRSRVSIERMEMPGVPPEIAERMKGVMAQHQQRATESCLTAQEVQRPKEEFFAGNDNCRYEHFTMGGGKIDAKMRCSAGAGVAQVMEMTGTYAPDTYQMLMSTRTEGSGAPGMTMQLRVQSNRVGACDATAA